MEEGSSSGWCKTTKLEKCTGDVTVQSRKQKKFPLYELEIKLKWEGQLWDAGRQGEVRGVGPRDDPRSERGDVRRSGDDGPARRREAGQDAAQGGDADGRREEDPRVVHDLCQAAQGVDLLRQGRGLCRTQAGRTGRSLQQHLRHWRGRVDQGRRRQDQIPPRRHLP